MAPRFRQLSSGIDRWGGLTAGLLAVLASLTVLGNDFSYDDIPVIRDDARLHTLAEPWEAFTQPYWPPPFAGLYRPVSSLLFAVEWQLGGGAPWFFHAVSILLYALTSVVIFIVARHFLSAPGAALAAALFAVHPVHTEAISLAVNQSEIIVAMLAAVSLGIFLRGRERGSLSSKRSLGLLGLYLAACLTKEHGIVLPALLLGAELTLVQDRTPFRVRFAQHRALALGFVLVALVFLMARAGVLDDPVGSFTAEALRGASVRNRALTMLSVVPEWTRLLVWPSMLQADYSPQEIVAANGFGALQALGTLLLALYAAAIIWTWKRRPVIAFGLVWIGISVLPVSNVLIPTGIVLAERTLFLASLGVVLLSGDLARWVGENRYAVRPVYRIAGGMAIGVVLVLGTIGSLARHPIWKNQLTLFRQTVVDAPLSYKAHWGFANVLVELDQMALAEARYRYAIELYPDEPRLLQRLGDLYRQASICDPALPLYQDALALRPEFWSIRVSLVGCLTHLGRYHEARAQAVMGVARGENVTNFQHFIAVIDSAAAAGAPPGSVALTGVEPIPHLEANEP